MAKGQILHSVTGAFIATKAIVLYEQKDGSREVTHFANIHSVVQSKVCEGRPLDRHELLNLCRVLMPHFGRGLAWQDERIIAYSDTAAGGTGQMIWWRPASVERLLFTEGTKIPDGLAPVPSLLFMASGGSLNVWALKNNTRPVPDTELWAAPLPNVSDGGNVCMGNAQVPALASPDVITTWERLFFRSRFSTHHMPQLANKTKAPKLWQTLIKQKAKEFPLDILVSAKTTLAGVLKRGAHGY